ncbi:MAG TPA: class I SAM-dependent methyltransferase [Gemmataceae bacterium]|nr:class I SAM-dependent methyltransferase [Gemmataceae bacterium]
MVYQTADSRRQFDRWSSRYDRDWLQTFFFEPAHRMVLEELTAADRRVLDVGCGTGRLAAAILGRFPAAQVWGLELSDGMLRECRKLKELAGGRLHLVQGDSERLPFADDAFDVVTCTHCFHHFPYQDRVAAEMHRVLRPGGRLLIIDGDRDRWWGRLLFDVLVVLVEGPVRHLTSEGFRQLYRASGFDQISQRRRGGPLPFVLTCGRAVKPAHSGQQAYRRSA